VTLVSKKGSSYLQPGARLLVSGDGSYCGEISAGCLEGQVSQQAVRCIAEGRNDLLTIDTRPFYGCSGEITLLIEVIQDTAYFCRLFESLEKARVSRESRVLVTDYQDIGRNPLTRLAEGGSQSELSFQEEVSPPVQLLVFGDWPDGQAAALFARKLGWSTKVFDASAPNFCLPGVFREHIFDRLTALLVSTHHLARDANLLSKLLREEHGYLGVVGSRKRRSELARILESYENLDLLEAFSQVACPAGLDLGGEGAQAIALSIVSEIQAHFTGRNGHPLVQRDLPIHTDADPSDE